MIVKSFFLLELRPELSQYKENKSSNILDLKTIGAYVLQEVQKQMNGKKQRKFSSTKHVSFRHTRYKLVTLKLP